MNTKISSLILQNLTTSFNLARYGDLSLHFNVDTQVHSLPWTPARFEKFKHTVEQALDLQHNMVGTVQQITDDLDSKYSARFFGEVWKPRTQDYTWSGWNLVERINSAAPRSVLDVGCGYHPFNGRIQSLVGIDPYNNCADYMVDILDYQVPPGSHDHIMALGSINFNSRQDIEARMHHCVNLLAPGGTIYMRVNPGLPHVNGPWVDIFAWNFAVVKEFEQQLDLKLETFKKDANNRLYFEYIKPF